MSNVERDPRETLCGGRAAVAIDPVRELVSGVEIPLGDPRAMHVTRTSPIRARVSPPRAHGTRDERSSGQWSSGAAPAAA
jgi:hypothetical protein